MTDLESFDIIIRQRGTQTFANIPQLGLYGKGHDIPSALAALEKSKNELREALASGLVDASAIVKPAKISAAANRRSLGMFTLKSAIVIALLFSAGVVATEVAAKRIESLITTAQPYMKIGGSRFWSKVEQDLERAAQSSSDMAEEKKKKLLTNIHVLVERWRPFVSEATQLFAPVQKADNKSP